MLTKVVRCLWKFYKSNSDEKKIKKLIHNDIIIKESVNKYTGICWNKIGSVQGYKSW